MIRSFMKKCILPTVLLLLSLVSFGQIPKNYNCYRATTKVIIDGNVYEDVWKETPWSDFFVDITGDTLLLPYYQTRMKMLWDESYLYVAAEMEDSNIWSYLENHDDIIYRDNDFEVFLDPDGDGLNYYEIEINALGTVLDLFMKKPYNRGGSADLKWNASGIKKAIKIYGHINDDSIEDIKWTVELAIPWNIYTKEKNSVSPPKNGDVWRVNFSRVQWETEFSNGKYLKAKDSLTGKVEKENNWVWSSQGVINMHMPEKWGTLTFINDFDRTYNLQLTKDDYPKFWIWMGGGSFKTIHDWETVFRLLDDAGIRGLLFGGNVDILAKMIPLAKQYDIKVHAWFWTMNRGDADTSLLSYNQLGQSLAKEKAYVNYYKFMCPSLPDTKKFILSKMDELISVDGLEGIHMDYIRYVDVILPIGLQPKYNLVQDYIMPKYDYGYHPYMRNLFEEKYGVDPLELKDPGNNDTWIQFRLDELNSTVAHIKNHVTVNDLIITAAVFPTPKMSSEMVRQNWQNWNLDCYFPMVYHNFYNENINWIEKVIREDRVAIGEYTNIFCGLYLPSLQKGNDLGKAINAAMRGGADGISLFSFGGLNKNTITQIKKFTTPN